MKKTYEKPQVWVESFIMDASIAAGSCSSSDMVQNIVEGWEVGGSEFFPTIQDYVDSLHLNNSDLLCYHTYSDDFTVFTS